MFNIVPLCTSGIIPGLGMKLSPGGYAACVMKVSALANSLFFNNRSVSDPSLTSCFQKLFNCCF